MLADEPLEAFTVGSLDMDTPIQTEPTTVIPAEHVLGVVGLQEAVAEEWGEEPGTGILRPSVGLWSL